MSTYALRSSTGVWIMVSTILASSMAFIDGTALQVVLPSLQRGLQADGVALFWILNAYLLMLAALILTGGSLGDRLGRKRVFMAGILVFILGSAACGLAPDAGILIACRIFQGLGGAFMIPGSLSLISASIDESERGKAIGTWSAVTTVVTVGGPILGGALADAGWWRGIFFINVPLGVAALLILRRKVPESRAAEDRGGLDWPGAVVIAVALALLTYGCLRIPSAGWSDGVVLGALGGGVVLLAWWVWIERRSRAPMMPLSLFANPVFSGVNALTFFLYAGLGMAMLFISLDLVQVQGYRQVQAGMCFLPFTAMMILLSRWAGALADRIGPRLPLIAGPVAAGLGMLALSFVGQTRGPADYWRSLLPGVALWGLGMSFTVAPLTATVMSSAGAAYSGVASGVNNALSRVAGVLANAILGALAVSLFTGALRQRADAMPMEMQERQAVMAQAPELGNARVPATVRAADRPRVAAAYRESFIAAYAVVLRVAAGLAFAGALMGIGFVKNPRVD